MRDSEGYKDRWYDKENDDEQYNDYYHNNVASITSDLYVTVESYAHDIVPTSCTYG